MNKGIVTRAEWQIFTRMSIEAQVDSSVSNIDSSAADTDQYGYDNVQKPPWVSDQAWDCIDKLEVLPVFSGLKQSLAKHSEQWREYFNVSSFDCNWTLLSHGENIGSFISIIAIVSYGEISLIWTQNGQIQRSVLGPIKDVLLL